MTKTIRRFSIAFPLAVLILSLFFQQECMEGVTQGLKIGFEKAFPALFPALVLSRILTAVIPRSSRKAAVFLPFFIGLACGFPLGAQAVKDLRKRELLSRKDGEKMLFFCGRRFIFTGSPPTHTPGFPRRSSLHVPDKISTQIPV